MNKVTSLLNEARALASTSFRECDLKDELIAARDDKKAGSARYFTKKELKEEDLTGAAATELGQVIRVVHGLFNQFANKYKMSAEQRLSTLDHIVSEIKRSETKEI